MGPDWTLDRRARNELLGIEVALANGELAHSRRAGGEERDRLRPAAAVLRLVRHARRDHARDRAAARRSPSASGLARASSARSRPALAGFARAALAVRARGRGAGRGRGRRRAAGLLRRRRGGGRRCRPRACPAIPRRSSAGPRCARRSPHRRVPGARACGSRARPTDLGQLARALASVAGERRRSARPAARGGAASPMSPTRARPRSRRSPRRSAPPSRPSARRTRSRRRVDVFGAPPEALPLMRALKARFDPGAGARARPLRGRDLSVDGGLSSTTRRHWTVCTAACACRTARRTRRPAARPARRAGGST